MLYTNLKKYSFQDLLFRITNDVILFIFLSFFCIGCNNKKTAEVNNLFTLVPSAETSLNFANNLTYTEEFNPYTFRNFFNGGGVAIGDINNDNLPDIFFCSNQQSNKLYLNKGNFQFEDITQKAGVSSDGVWSTGVTMADVNGDGWVDIYVCKSGDLKGKNRSNELFINNGFSPSPSGVPIGTGRGEVAFTEKAKEYGLDNRGLSTHAVFFDYDNDGDLDCYLLNNSFRSVGNYDLMKDQRNIADTLGGNKLYRNDGNNFSDVTQRAGIYSSKIGFGLGVTISDVNKDGWQDIYVSNDFFEKDYLYINHQDGTFRESLEKCIREISMNSMGADIADINNDGFSDIYVTDMFPEEESRIKTKTNFENWDKYKANTRSGYYKQFVRNSLQLNLGFVEKNKSSADEVYFSEISRYANVSATDWSWGALIADLNNDGLKDVFVANGIYKDITDQDYIQYAANESDNIRKQINNKEKNIIKNLVDLIPSHAIPNYAFSNNGDLTFSNKAKEWGLDEPGFSNGSAYGDLDNDGDLDLVINNVNMPCFIYRNESVQQHPENKFLKVSLQGEGKNTFGIGA
ncbi:MAG TPA: VCBS repeat-containing protein, partial [Segetibacter sp.]|nr:VCBS repeat-containing protein [Segetibacter sp.]